MSYTDPLKNKPEYFGINGLRFFAAFWVLLFHTGNQFGTLHQLRWIQPVLNQGTLAMTLFFTLSGFILSYRYPLFSCPADRHAYWAARIARLYPVYLFMGLASAWLLFEPIHGFAIVDKFGLFGQWAIVAFSIPLFVLALQAWFPSLFVIWNFGGSWSLSVEAFFYTIFPFLRTRIHALSSQTLFGLICLLVFFVFALFAGHLITMKPDHSSILLYYLLPIFRLPEFLIGMVGYVLFVQRGQYRNWLKWVGGIFLLLLVLGIYSPDIPGLIEWDWLAVVPFLAAFTFSIPLKAPQWVMRPINYLGRISYCVYLAQFSTLPIVRSFQSRVTTEIAWILGIGFSLLAAMLCYHLVEVLAYNKTRAIALRFFTFRKFSGT